MDRFRSPSRKRTGRSASGSGDHPAGLEFQKPGHHRCPITNKVKGFPFEVVLPADPAVKGAVLADHIKCMDHTARNLSLIGMAPQGVAYEVLARVAPLVS